MPVCNGAARAKRNVPIRFPIRRYQSCCLCSLRVLRRDCFRCLYLFLSLCRCCCPFLLSWQYRQFCLQFVAAEVSIQSVSLFSFRLSGQSVRHFSKQNAWRSVRIAVFLWSSACFHWQQLLVAYGIHWLLAVLRERIRKALNRHCLLHRCSRQVRRGECSLKPLQPEDHAKAGLLLKVPWPVAGANGRYAVREKNPGCLLSFF